MYIVSSCIIICDTATVQHYNDMIVSTSAPSGPPAGVSAAPSSARSLSISWSPPARDQQNGIIRYYLVTVRSEFGVETRNISSIRLSTSISGLRPHTRYNCTVQAQTVRLGPPNDVIVVVTPQDSEFGTATPYL